MSVMIDAATVDRESVLIAELADAESAEHALRARVDGVRAELADAITRKDYTRAAELHDQVRPLAVDVTLAEAKTASLRAGIADIARDRADVERRIAESKARAQAEIGLAQAQAEEAAALSEARTLMAEARDRLVQVRATLGAARAAQSAAGAARQRVQDALVVLGQRDPHVTISMPNLVDSWISTANEGLWLRVEAYRPN